MKPSVVACAVAEEDYSVSNLIAEDLESLGRGFMCIPSSRPPVDIIFNFPKAVDIKVIKLWPGLGKCRTTSLEIHGLCSGNWELVAFVSDIHRGVEVIDFFNQTDYFRKNSPQAAIATEYSERVYFIPSAYNVLDCTKSVKVVIRATDNCAPVVRRVEMWGLPSHSLDEVDKELLHCKWEEISNPFGQGNALKDTRIPQLKEQSSLVIPESFLDKITCELMMVPIILPSGNRISKSTLAKYELEEAQYGRKPSDPFTDQIYDHDKLDIDLELQRSIRKFLRDNSKDFKDLPPCYNNRNSLPNQNTPPPEQATTSSHQPDQPDRQNTTSTSSASFSGSPPLSSSPGPMNTHENTPCAASVSPVPINQQAPISGSTTMAPLDTSLESPETPSQQLPPTIADTAASTPPVPINQQAPPDKCNYCDSPQYRYEIRTCHHRFCSDCLRGLLRDMFCVCKNPFRASDVTEC